jgi:hypothetical protein
MFKGSNFKITDDLKEEIVDYIADQYSGFDKDTLISLFIDGFTGLNGFTDLELVWEMESCTGIEFDLADEDDSDIINIPVALKLLREIRDFEFEEEVLNGKETS